MRAPVPQPLRSSSSGLATACRRRTPAPGEDPAGRAHALVVPGEEAVPDGVLVERGRERGARAGHDRGAHRRGSAARGLGVMPRRYVRAHAGPPPHRLRPYPANTHGGGADRLHPDDRRGGRAPTRRLPHRRPQPDQPQVETQPVGGGEQARRGRRTAPGRACPRGGPPGSRSRSVHGDQRRQPGGGERVDDQRAAGPQQPGALGEHADVVLDVLEDLARQDDVGAAVGQRHRQDRAAHRRARRASRAAAAARAAPRSTPTCR